MLLFLSAAAASCANTPSVAEASPCIKVDILELSAMATSSFIRSATEEKHQKGGALIRAIQKAYMALIPYLSLYHSL